jgi:hypothetical protein
MAESERERKGISRWVYLPGLVLAVALGRFIYSGIHGRVEALNDSNWVVSGRSGAAARLGVKRTTLIYKMRKCRPHREKPL